MDAWVPSAGPSGVGWGEAPGTLCTQQAPTLPCVPGNDPARESFVKSAPRAWDAEADGRRGVLRTCFGGDRSPRYQGCRRWLGTHTARRSASAQSSPQASSLGACRHLPVLPLTRLAHRPSSLRPSSICKHRS